MPITILKQPKFDSEECKTCGHPKALHKPLCWSHGYAEEKRCRRKCEVFKRDNLKWLEGEFKKHANTSKVQRLRA